MNIEKGDTVVLLDGTVLVVKGTYQSTEQVLMCEWGPVCDRNVPVSQVKEVRKQ